MWILNRTRVKRARVDRMSWVKAVGLMIVAWKNKRTKDSRTRMSVKIRK